MSRASSGDEWIVPRIEITRAPSLAVGPTSRIARSAPRKPAASAAVAGGRACTRCAPATVDAVVVDTVVVRRVVWAQPGRSGPAIAHATITTTATGAAATALHPTGGTRSRSTVTRHATAAI